MSNLCNPNFETHYAFISKDKNDFVHGNKVMITIDDYIVNKKLQERVRQGDIHLYCEQGHELEQYFSMKRKSHFRHKHSGDVGGEPMTKWHAEWQSNFPNTEVAHRKFGKCLNNRRADVLVHNTVIEFQYSPITKEKVDRRKHDYTLHSRELHWVVECNYCIHVEPLDVSDTFLITFTTDFWKYESFMSHDYIFLDQQGKIYKICPRDVKSHMIDVIEYKEKEQFIKSYFDQIYIWSTKTLPQCTLFFNQRGAGCGKTFESIQLLSNNKQFSHKTTFIYLTKMHSAKEVIYNELKEQYNQQHLRNIQLFSDKQVGKQYKIVYDNVKTNKKCTVIIGTIDSFMFALGDKNNRHQDFFGGLIESIKNGYLNVCSSGGFKYASQQMLLNKQCLLLIDEAQDLPHHYVQAIAKVMRGTYVDAYIIGDKLQSIWGEDNIYTYLEKNELPHVHTVKDVGDNIVRRFHNTQFIDFVNGVIDFSKYNLPSVIGICDGNCKYQHQDNICPIKVFSHKPIYSNDKDITKMNHIIDIIVKLIQQDVKDYNYLPNNFMFIFPIMKNNTLADMIEARLQDFWIEMFEESDYRKNVLSNNAYWQDKIKSNIFHKFTVLHKSDENQPINVKESEHATRLLSIHASKGMGCEVVFLLGVSESSLNCFTKETSDLQYDSLLHVAITRQKKKLYVGLVENNDDIHQRFNNFVADDNTQPFVTRISKYNKLETVCQHTMTHNFKFIDETYIKPYDMEHFIPTTITDKEHVIDWGHHIVRYCVMFYSMMSNFINNTPYLLKGAQFQTILNEISKKELDVCHYQKYFKHLWTMYDERNKEESEKTYKNIPILSFEAKEHSQYLIYTRLLVDFVHVIQSKIKKCQKSKQIPLLCPLEMAIVTHLIQLLKSGKFLHINVINIYDIMHTYCSCFDPNTDNHETYGCLCNKSFCHVKNETKRDTSLSIKDSIMNHYEITKQISGMFDKTINYLQDILQIKSDLTIHVEHTIWFAGNNDSFALLTMKPMIAFSKSHVIYFVIKPSFNKLNFSEIITDCIYTQFITTNCSEDSNNYNRYNNKSFIVCLLTFDSPNPIFFPIPKGEDYILRNCIRCCLYDRYLELNKMIIRLYNYCVKNKPSNKNSIQFTTECIKDTVRVYPQYVVKFLEQSQEIVLKLPVHERKGYVTLERMNEYLAKLVDDYVKQPTEEECDF